MWGPNPLLLREKLGVGGPSHLYGALSTLGFVSWPFVFLSMKFFFFSSIGVTQLVSGSLSEAIFPPVVTHSVCSWEEGSSGAFCHHLGQLLLVYLKVTYLNGT